MTREHGADRARRRPEAEAAAPAPSCRPTSASPGGSTSACWRWADPQPDETAVDLYAGVGAISFYLAGRARLVIGVEENPIAVLDAKQNIRLNGYHNVRFFDAPAAAGAWRTPRRCSAASTSSRSTRRARAPTTPTRARHRRRAPSRIVYVSCDPGTLARDLDWFAGARLASRALQPFDMLPQTEHVECVALLRAERRRAAGVKHRSACRLIGAAAPPRRSAATPARRSGCTIHQPSAWRASSSR